MELKNYFRVGGTPQREDRPRHLAGLQRKTEGARVLRPGAHPAEKCKGPVHHRRPGGHLRAPRRHLRRRKLPGSGAPRLPPETALHPEQANFRDWVSRLGQVTGKAIASLRDLEEALSQRAFYFKERGCPHRRPEPAVPRLYCGHPAGGRGRFYQSPLRGGPLPRRTERLPDPAASKPGTAVQENGLCDAAPLWGAAQPQTPGCSLSPGRTRALTAWETGSAPTLWPPCSTPWTRDGAAPPR